MTGAATIDCTWFLRGPLALLYCSPFARDFSNLAEAEISFRVIVRIATVGRRQWLQGNDSRQPTSSGAQRQTTANRDNPMPLG